MESLQITIFSGTDEAGNRSHVLTDKAGHASLLDR